MGGDPRVQRLLEEILDSERSPEEVCRDCAELLPQVRLRWKAAPGRGPGGRVVPRDGLHAIRR